MIIVLTQISQYSSEGAKWNNSASQLGVAVAMVISAMHGKIKHKFSQCMEIWKKFQNSVIHISCNCNDDTATEESLRIS